MPLTNCSNVWPGSLTMRDAPPPSALPDVGVLPRIVPRRKVLGMSAVLLPFEPGGCIDWVGFTKLLDRTVEAGLVPAVNMDTGYVQLLDAPSRTRVVEVTAEHAGERGFVAGAYVGDDSDRGYDESAHAQAMAAIVAHDGIPVVFPSPGLNALDEDDWVAAHERLGADVDRFIAFELGAMFVPYGRIYSLDAYTGLLAISSCIGAKHSSLSRQLEWDRLAQRDAHRPEFHVFTGNDLAIDMVCYGSDYLLGLSAFAPDVFAERDRRWAEGDPSFYELNDALQYLGAFSFRAPVPAYRHDAALFLRERGWIACDATPAGAPRRPEGERAVLVDVARRLGVVP
jgi:dihydrodipicolinate synthase/N-acetylneuraminate lyase